MLPKYSPLVKGITPLIGVILFSTGYWICQWAYDYNTQTEQWWNLRLPLITLAFMAVCFSGFFLSNGFTRAVFLVGIIFCGGDIVDRGIFDINQFSVNDILLYLFALIYLPKEYVSEIQASNT